MGTPTFVDVDGLSITDPEQTCDLLLLEGAHIRGHDRLPLLARLRRSVGVTVVTGPWGADFWSIVSPAVKVKVEPDGYELEGREQDLWAWAVRQQGKDRAYAKALNDKPPVRGERLAVFDRATALLECLEKFGSVSPPLLSGGAVEILTEEEAIERIKSLDGAYVALDYEWVIGSRDSISAVSWSDHKSDIYVPLRDSPSAGRRVLETVERELARDLSVVCHDARADLSRHPDPLALFGAPVDDTLVMAFVAGETAELGLKQLTKRLLGRDPMKYPENFEDLPVDVQAYYAANGDTRNTFDLARLLSARLAAQGMYEFYLNVERPIVPIVAAMEKVGSPVDIEACKRLQSRWQRAEERVRGIYLRRGYDIALDAEIRRLVSDCDGYDPGSVAKGVLSKIPGRHIDGVLLYRKLRTTRRNYLDKIIEAWDAAGSPADFRLYPRFNQAGSTEDGQSFKSAPKTGRFSSSKPNLTQQPNAIREAFIALDGYTFWARDWNSMELWIAALLSGDEGMMAALRAGDLHADFRERIKVLTGVAVTRTAAKQGNFLMQYGGEADKLVATMALQRAELDYQTAKVIVDAHKKAYPQLHAHNAQVAMEAHRKGYAETYFGRRRYIPELRDPDPKVRSHGERAAVNHPVQGTGADMLKIVMAELVPVLRKFGAHMSLVRHDELGGWVPSDRAAEFEAELIEVTDSVIIKGHRMTTSGGLGRNWLEAKK